MITEEQYKQAQKQREEAQEVIDSYFKEKIKKFEQRLVDNSVFTEDELIYSAYTRCLCGHGLAYPKECGPNHYWDCSAILKGTTNKDVQHIGKLPFIFYDIKSESEIKGTTRNCEFILENKNEKERKNEG